MDERKNRLPVILGLLASLVFHALIVWVEFAPNLLPEKLAEDSQPIELTEAPPEPPPASPPTSAQAAPKKIKAPQTKPEMAETEDANNKKIDPNAKYLSDRNQVADKQTRAKSIDDFREKQGSGLKNEMTSKNAMPATGDPSKAQAEETEQAKEDEGNKEPVAIGNSNLEVADTALAKKEAKAKKEAAAAVGIKRDWKTLSMKDLGVGGDGGQTAASDDKLDGVDTGERTILSTREYRYFSYYHRIKELLRQYWKPNVESKLYHMWEKGKTVGDDEMVTRLIVMLDQTGNIQKISRVGSCGVTDLDEAAVEAFQKAAPFPNPPKGIVEADGYVRITWEFILKTEAAPRIQFSNAGNGGSHPP